MKTRNPIVMALVLLALSTLDSHLATAFAQGTLAPPGPPAPAMVTLSQIYSNLEARTPISSLPYAITNSGSYYLTTNLTGVSGHDGIDISVSDVTLDLNGFTLKGAAGSDDGINVLNSVGNLAIRNGTVVSWGDSGVDADDATNSIVTGCTVSGNGDDGIDTGDNGIVKDCTASGNSGAGIGVGNNCLVTGCTASGNSDFGINVFNNCLVTGCTASGSYNYGISTVNNCLVTGCTASGNHYAGIFVGNNCIVTGCTASGNSGDGIDILSGGNRVEGNNAGGNGGYGISPASVNEANIIIRNSAPGNVKGAYYNTTNNNDFGPIQTPGTATSPWANF